MAAPDRFSVLASLPPLGGFRRVLALDHAGATRAVVIAFAPSHVTDDPPRLVAVLRDAEAAVRLHHPCAAAVLGTETVGVELAVVELHRRGTSVGALLEAGGRLPRDVAARIVLDACAALERAHAIDAGDGARLSHGALGAKAVAVGPDGTGFVSGFGLGAGGDVASDLRELGALLFECLSGEPPGDPPRRLGISEVPPALAAAVDRATGAVGSPFTSAAELAAAITEAIAPAEHAAVAAYSDAVLPGVDGERAEVRRTVASGPAVAAPASTPAAAPATTPDVVADAAGTFPRPHAAQRRSRLPMVVATLCLAAGFAIGLWLSRGRHAWPPWAAIPTSAATQAPTPAASPTSTPVPTAPPNASATPAPTASAAPPADGQPAPKQSAAERRNRPAPARTGRLDVTAPDDAEVFLDGRRIGRGSVQIEVAEGRHRIEVRRDGAAAAERFTLRPGETWTYTVTPTPLRDQERIP